MPDSIEGVVSNGADAGFGWVSVDDSDGNAIHYDFKADRQRVVGRIPLLTINEWSVEARPEGTSNRSIWSLNINHNGETLLLSGEGEQFRRLLGRLTATVHPQLNGVVLSQQTRECLPFQATPSPSNTTPALPPQVLPQPAVGEPNQVRSTYPVGLGRWAGIGFSTLALIAAIVYFSMNGNGSQTVRVQIPSFTAVADPPVVGPVPATSLTMLTVDPASQISSWEQLPAVTLQATYVTVPRRTSSIYDVEAYFNAWWIDACRTDSKDNAQLIDGVIADPATDPWLLAHDKIPTADDCGRLGQPVGDTRGDFMSYSLDVSYASGRKDVEQMTFQYFDSVARWLLIS